MPTDHPIASRTQHMESLRLRAAIRQGLRELEAQLRRTHRLETALNQFAEAYFTALGTPSLQAMARIGIANAAAQAGQLSALSQQHAANQRAIRQSYRRVMKCLHPDRADHSQPESIHAAQAAYWAKDLASLVCMEIALAPPPLDAPHAGLEALEAKLEHIGLALHDAEQRYTRLTQSALYACWQRAELDRMAGRNWIATVADRIHRELHAKRRALLALGLAALPS